MKIDAEVREELEAIARRSGCELLDAGFRGGVLQLVLDSEDGVTIDACATVSREASAFLDVVDFGPGGYTLEVTSPGLDREFYSAHDYERFSGSQVRITWLKDGEKRSDIGRLLAFEATRPPSVSVELPDGKHEIELEQIIKTRLEPEL